MNKGRHFILNQMKKIIASYLLFKTVLLLFICFLKQYLFLLTKIFLFTQYITDYSIAWHNGKRTDKDFLILWNSLQLFDITQYHTDAWGSYSVMS
jgi:hypothetical protein